MIKNATSFAMFMFSLDRKILNIHFVKCFNAIYKQSKVLKKLTLYQRQFVTENRTGFSLFIVNQIVDNQVENKSYKRQIII